MEKFRELGLCEATLTALEKKGFEEPSEIQALTIPKVLTTRDDIIAQAQTGTGKTATFALPLIEQLDESQNHVQAIILAPTRELVIQICEEISSLKGESRLAIAPIYGGQSIELQLRKLKRGVQIVVGTPGRLLDHLKRKTLKLDRISDFVMDEADEMLNMGFIDDIETIMEHTPESKRTLLFSATMPPRIQSLANKYLDNPTVIKTKTKLTTNLTDQIYFEVAARDKFEALCRIVDIEEEFYAIIFCRTKNETDDISHHLIERGYSADALHGDISQHMRERILNKFRKKSINILVATDVAARGIDVTDLTHVINYSLPQNPEAYVHRIGRTGRAGREGTAITFITPSEFRKLGFIKKVAKADIRKENVPSIKDIITQQKKQIQAKLSELSESGEIEKFAEWAEILLGEFDEPINLVTSLLTYSFGDKLDASNYRELSPIRRRDGGRDGGRDRGRDRDRGGRDRDRGGRDRDRGGRDGGRGGRDGGRDRSGRDRGFDAGKRGFERDRDNDRSGGGRFVDSEGTTRLFIALGKSDGFNKKKMLDMIDTKGGVNSRGVTNLSVHDNYSFVTAPFDDAEKLLQKFRNKGEDNRPLITKAKARR